MININIIRNNIQILENALKKRNSKIDLNNLKNLESKFKNDNLELEKLNQKRNEISAQIANLIKQQKHDEVTNLKNQMQLIKTNIEKINQELKVISDSLEKELLNIPNIPDDSVPIGKDENENIEVKKWSEPTKFNFNFKPHWELIEQLDIAELDKATKITGSRFVVYKGLGSKLIRALQHLTLQMHEQKGYIEYGMPVIVNSDSLYGTGQLPKFKEDLFAICDTNYFLSPTLEVQLTNLYRDEIIEEKKLPLKLTASSLNFRSEAGSAGKDTRGVIRQHQFYKTELVNIVHPEDSFKALEEMTLQAESILEALKLPYRRIILCTGDMGFSSAKTYDIEVWMPSYNAYKEISSCSNCLDFQARRAKIRFKNTKTNKNELVHTLNGSGLAIDRLFAAVVENYQNEDGTIRIPEVLIPFMQTTKISKQ